MAHESIPRSGSYEGRLSSVGHTGNKTTLHYRHGMKTSEKSVDQLQTIMKTEVLSRPASPSRLDVLLLLWERVGGY